jgi:phytoene desaturase
MPEKHLVIVGAGPGGLTTAMLLANRGFKVTVLEKSDKVGGRNSDLEFDGFRFDIGPTFLMMKFILDEIFEESGTKSSEHLEFTQLEPMYSLHFPGFRLDPTTDHRKLASQIKEAFPGLEEGLDRFLLKEEVRFRRMYPCLQKPYLHWYDMMRLTFLKASLKFLTPRSLFGVLSSYYPAEDLAICFTFQSKYLGMSPWVCPGAFAIIPYVEHAYGVFHTKGGLSEISRAMERFARDRGAEIRLGAKVDKLIIENGSVKGARLEDGEEVRGDETVINADFAHAMTHLVDEGLLKKYSRERVDNMKYSCSTFMMYLGLDKLYDYPHHSIIFSSDYRGNIEDIFTRRKLSDEISFYVRNASVTDPTLAPEGKSNIYILVPVPNNKSSIDWSKEEQGIREKVLGTIEKRTPMKDIREHIVAERTITPAGWESDYGVHQGATFNLAHNMGQMMYFRPRNRFEELANCYIVGGGTHPGSGLPTIYESGRIAANLISKKYGVEYPAPRKPPTAIQ